MEGDRSCLDSIVEREAVKKREKRKRRKKNMVNNLSKQRDTSLT